jgi:hypothetical protein
MNMQYTQIGSTTFSRLLLGGNPISGFSHQGTAVDQQMRDYYTKDRVLSLLQEAVDYGINGLVARVDAHILDLMAAYDLPHQPIRWLAQTAPEAGSPLISAERAIRAGAAGCHIHGGVMDFMLAQGRLAEIPSLIRQIREMGMLAGIAGHRPEIFAWARSNLDVDYMMCAYYNPTSRDQIAAHISGSHEVFLDQDREAMTGMIQTLSVPVIHYKIFAAGRNDPQSAIKFAVNKMRPGDMACIGIYAQNHPNMLDEDVAMFQAAFVEENLEEPANQQDRNYL